MDLCALTGACAKHDPTAIPVCTGTRVNVDTAARAAMRIACGQCDTTAVL